MILPTYSTPLRRIFFSFVILLLSFLYTRHTPVHAETTVSAPYMMGAYYMPFPRTPTFAWKFLRYYNELPSVKGTNKVRKPLLGFYNNADPRVLTWQIDTAYEHGIGYFLFDEFWVSSQKTPIFNTALPAFLQAPNNKKLSFAVGIWGNSGTSAAEIQKNFTTTIAHYHKTHYFTQSNYLRINGKPVVVIGSPGYLAETNPPAVKALLKAYEQTAGTAIYWVHASPTSFKIPTDDAIKRVADMGFTAMIPYYAMTLNDEASSYKGTSYGAMAQDIINTNSLYLEKAKKYGLQYVPTATAGFTELPRYEMTPDLQKRTYPTNPTLSGYTYILSSVKKLADNNLASTGSVIPKIGNKPLINLSPFKEWPEALSLEPGQNDIVTGSNPFAILDTIRSVFSVTGDKATNKIPATIETSPITNKHIWTSQDTSSIFTSVNSSDWAPVTSDTAKVVVVSSNSMYWDIATNIPRAESYSAIKVQFKVTCASQNCLKSMGTDVISLNSNGIPMKNSYFAALNGCRKDSAGWYTCLLVPRGTANSSNLAGTLLNLQIIYFANNVYPYTIYMKKISVIYKGDLDANDTVNQADVSLFIQNFGKPLSALNIPSTEKLDIFTYNKLVENFGK